MKIRKEGFQAIIIFETQDKTNQNFNIKQNFTTLILRVNLNVCRYKCKYFPNQCVQKLIIILTLGISPTLHVNRSSPQMWRQGLFI
jgi:hypothetical protein